MNQTPFEAEMDDTLLELLDEFGWEATLSRESGEGSYDRDTMEYGESDPDEFDVEAMFFDPTSSSLSGFEQNLDTDYILSRKWLIVRSKSAKVKTGDKIVNPTHGTVLLDKVTAVGPNNPIYYKVSAEVVSL